MPPIATSSTRKRADIDRAGMGDRRTHNHDNRGERRHPEARVYRCEQGERRDSNRESNQKRKFHL